MRNALKLTEALYYALYVWLPNIYGLAVKGLYRLNAKVSSAEFSRCSYVLRA